MMYGIWEIAYLAICLLSLVLGWLRGGLRTFTFFSAHLFPCVLALVFSPWAGDLYVSKTSLPLGSYFFVFLLLYLIPMVLLTQLFRVLYGKKPGEGRKISLPGRLGGFFAGLATGAFFSLLFTWILILQPWIGGDKIYALGGTLFTHAAAILQVFMRFYV